MGDELDDLSRIDAVILAGGLGTRLRPVLGQHPKALAPVAGRPFLTILLEQLERAGLARAVICAGHQGDLLRQSLGQRFGRLRLIYSQEERPLGTGGALRLACPLLDSELALAMNGDSFCQADLADLARWRRAKAAPAAMLLAWVNDAARYGRVELDQDGAITAFREKEPQGGAGWINAGVYLVERRWLEAIPQNREVSLEREIFPAWVGRGLHGYAAGQGFLDIGTPESLAQAQDFFAASDRAPWPAPPRLDGLSAGWVTQK